MASIIAASTVGSDADGWRPAVSAYTSGGMLRFVRPTSFPSESLAYGHANGDAEHVSRILARALAALGYTLAES